MEYEITHFPDHGADLQWFVFALTMTDGEESSVMVATFGAREDAAEYVTLKGGTIAD